MGGGVLNLEGKIIDFLKGRSHPCSDIEIAAELDLKVGAVRYELKHLIEINTVFVRQSPDQTVGSPCLVFELAT